MKNPWRTISTRIIYKNKWITIREDQVIRPDGKKGIYGVVDMGTFPLIAALTQEEEIYLVGQYRYTIDKYSWELPAGYVMQNESILRAAKRELKEETGLIAKKWTNLGILYEANSAVINPGVLFLAENLRKVRHSKNYEKTSIKKLKLSEVINLIMQNKIDDGKTVAAIFKVKEFLGRRQK